MQYKTLSAEPFGSGRMRREPADARGEATRGVDGQSRPGRGDALRRGNAWPCVPGAWGPMGPLLGPRTFDHGTNLRTGQLKMGFNGTILRKG